MPLLACRADLRTHFRHLSDVVFFCVHVVRVQHIFVVAVAFAIGSTRPPTEGEPYEVQIRGSMRRRGKERRRPARREEEVKSLSGI